MEKIQHCKTSSIETLVKHNVPVMLTGEKGSGKTTMIKQVAETLDLDFYCMSMTRQTTLSILLGFHNVEGTYIPSILYQAATKGGLFLLDEIDAADANVLLSLNTIENGFISFPTGIVELHKDFRLAATANPQDQHSEYTGRVKLDAATLDRYDIIEIERDANLELQLVSSEAYLKISTLREVLAKHNSTKVISMRDTLRLQKRIDLNLTDGFIERIIGDYPLILENYKDSVRTLPKYMNQNECVTFDDLIECVTA